MKNFYMILSLMISTIYGFSQVTVSITSSSNVNCFGGGDGTATASATGGTAPYTYAWSDLQTTQTATGLAAGVYSVTVTSADSLTGTNSVTITEPPALIANAGADHTIQSGQPDSLHGAASGGFAPYTYLWNNGGVTATIVVYPTITTTYTLTVTDANNCTATDIVVVNVGGPAPVADFSAAPLSICAGGVINFYDQSSNIPTSWNWDFGDGSTSTIQDPTHVYSTPGVYSVSLTATNANGSNTFTNTDYITVNPLPVANAGPDVTSGPGDTVQIGSATDSLNSYLWNTGGSTSYINVSPTLTTTYTVTVTNNFGCSAVDNVTVTIGSESIMILSPTGGEAWNAGTNQNIAWTSSGVTQVDLYYSINNGSTWNMITDLVQAITANYSWTVPSVSSSACLVKIQSSSNALVYSVSGSVFTITSGSALTATISSSSNVTCNGGSNGSATVSATNGTTPYTYLWSNGQTTPVASNLAAGSYTVTVTDANSGSATATATINQPPLLTATASGTNASCGTADGTASVSATGGIAPYSYLWSNSSTTQSISGLTAGVYTVTISDANACTATASTTISNTGGPTVTVIPSSTNICQGSTINLTASGANTYSWEPPAGLNTTTGSQVVASPAVSTTYTVTGSDAGGCTGTAQVSVNVTPAPVAYAGQDTTIYPGDTVQIGAQPDSLSTYLWSPETYIIGLNTSNPWVFPQSSTTYTVMVTANGCTATDDITVNVFQISTCTAAFESFPDTLPTILNFYNMSSGYYTNVFWDFGDGSVSSLSENVLHNFAEQGYHTVCLTISDSAGACFSETCLAILVGNPNGACNADFSYTLDTGNTVTFNSVNSAGNITGVIWDFGDGATSALFNPVHSYTAPAYFNVTLTVNDSVSNCLSSITKIIESATNNNDCQAEFIWTAGTSDNNISFIDNSLGSGLNNYLWNFGNGEFANTQDTVYHYTLPGYYLACLTVSGNNCQNTKCKDVQAGTNPNSCKADFDYVSEPVPGKASSAKSRFKGSAIGNPSKGTWDILWEFGDGATDTILEPEHVYANTGLYLVHFRISSASCSDDYFRLINAGSDNTGIKGAFGHVTLPGTKANTQGSDFRGSAIGDPSKINWDFGDGNHDSTTWEPYHEYPVDSLFIACLTISDPITGQENVFCDTVDTKTGIRKNDFNKPVISLYPNPAGKIIYLIITQKAPEQLEIGISDLSGRTLGSFNTERDPAVSFIKEISIENLKNGFYFIKVKAENSIQYLKFVKD